MMTRISPFENSIVTAMMVIVFDFCRVYFDEPTRCDKNSSHIVVLESKAVVYVEGGSTLEIFAYFEEAGEDVPELALWEHTLIKHSFREYLVQGNVVVAVITIELEYFCTCSI